MKIVVDMNHPAHVHYFKNFIRAMEKKGNEVLITASKKDVTFSLLDSYGMGYVNLGSYGNNILSKFFNLFLMDLKMYGSVRKFNPDIFLGFGSIRASHVAFLMGKKCINFDDTEHSMEQKILYLPFVSAICTPACYKRALGNKQVSFNGFIELASLYPGYFYPDPSVLEDAGVAKNEKFIIVRLVSWNATHDVGQHGIEDKEGFVKELEKYGKVLISSEKELPESLKRYEVKISPEKIHSLLYYASLYIGEGATMATESALLGTPSIYISSLAGTMGNFEELEKDYHLLYSFDDAGSALKKASEILGDPGYRSVMGERLKKLFSDKIDVTDFMVRLIERYSSGISGKKKAEAS
jgi:hypothetical protein